MSAWISITRRWARFTNKFINVPYGTAGLDIDDMKPQLGVGMAFIPKIQEKGQLTYETKGACLLGPDEDVVQILRLDAIIGKLTRPFNGAAAVPQHVINEIQKHINDVAPCLTRVGAFIPEKKKSGIDTLFNIDILTGQSERQAVQERKLVPKLEYTNYYLRNNVRISQPFARLKLGARR